ncbi:MAG: DUF4838 domain-containing protein [Phycisphaerae bacterium]
MQIVIDPSNAEPHDVTSFAGRELRLYMDKVKRSDEDPKVIALGIVDQRGAGAPLHPVHDGYCLTWSETELQLTAITPKGLLNGVYEVLELLGFAFPFPGLDRYPSKQNWAAVKTNANGQWRVPSFRHRILHFDNMRLTPAMIDWIGKLKINMLQQPLHVYKADIGADPNLIKMIKERGMELNIGCHGFDNWLPPKRYGKDHPEWYGTSHAVRRGELHETDDHKLPSEFTSGQLCLSNRQMIREFAANVVAFLREHPEVRTVSFWPNDMAGGWCTCENCLALEPDPNKMDPQTGSPGRSTTYLWFINQVGQIVHAEVSDARIEFAAFYDFATPPGDHRAVPKGDHYLGFLIDDYFGCLLHGHGESWNRDRIETFHRQWREIFSGEIYALGYYADLYKIMDFPIVLSTKIKDDFTYLKDEIGIDSVSTLVVCAELDYLLNFHFQNIYAYAALAWNHRRSSASLLKELAAAICPQKCESLYDYFSIWDNLGVSNPNKHGGWIWIEPDPQQKSSPWASVTHFLRVDELVNEATFERLQSCLDEAKSDRLVDEVSQKVVERMSMGFNVFKSMYRFNPKASPEERLKALSEIKGMVSMRRFPAGTMPMLDRWENEAKTAL